jgi:hypothetical protein
MNFGYSGYCCDLHRCHLMETFHSSRLPTLSFEDVRRYGWTDLRETSPSYRHNFNESPTSHHRMSFNFFTLGLEEGMLNIYRSQLSFWRTAKRCLSWRRERYLFVVASVDLMVLVHIAQALFLCVYYNLDDRGPRPRTNSYLESELSFILHKCLLAC